VTASGPFDAANRLFLLRADVRLGDGREVARQTPLGSDPRSRKNGVPDAPGAT